MQTAPRNRKRAKAAAVAKPERLEFASDIEWLNHRAFRFPAKFHPPVARALVEKFSTAGELVLDPFCGSGTILVEALASGRHALGYDIDPVAVFVSHAKTRIHNLPSLTERVGSLAKALRDFRSADLKRDGSFEDDISKRAYTARLSKFGYRIPDIPRMQHWFRNRVVLQLCQIRDLFERESDAQTALFLKLCFASIIRNASNADPVPVSGLEVTSHMLDREEDGRAIDPYELAILALKRNLKATEAFQGVVAAPQPRCQVAARDASLPWLENVPKADVVITSPPYLNAVDYYRRHTLEMYWLDLVDSHEDRLELLPRYIGRVNPRKDQVPTGRVSPSGIEQRWIKKLSDFAPERVCAVQHYAATMQIAIENQAKALKKNGRLVLVVGDSKIMGKPFPTAQLLQELSVQAFESCQSYWYPIRNRYMSYERHNGADIAKETVLVLKRK